MAELRLGNDVVIPQAYDPLRPFAVEVDAGKQFIANAINEKGGEASADESFNQLATDIINIPTNIQVEDAAKAVYPDIAWNILSEAYAQQRAGYPALICAEFYKDADTIDLSGADAYLTCDGDFYTEATTHTWHDEAYNKVNRYVIYYFESESMNYSVTNADLCPVNMAVIGKIGSVNVAVAGKIGKIYNAGEINDISFASTNNWDKEVYIGGVKEHNSGYVLNTNANVQMFASDIEVLNGGNVIYGNNSALKTAILPNLKEVNGGRLFETNNVIYGLISLSFPQLERITNGYLIYCDNNVGVAPNITLLELPKLQELNNGYIIGMMGASVTPNFRNLREIICNSLIKGGSTFFNQNIDASTFPNLIQIEIGQGYNGNIQWRLWRATEAIRTDDNSLVDEGETFANNREKFLYNFEHYIIDKLADNSETGMSYTITLSTAVYPIVSATTAITDKLTAKHWNIAQQ